MTNRLSALHSLPGLFAALIFSVPQLQAKPAAGSLAERTPGAKGKSEQITSPDQVPQGLAKSDWSSIHAAHKAWEHSFMPTKDGWQARNPGQQWTTQFDGRGFLAKPKAADWQWGLELQSYGFGQQQRPVKGQPEVKAEGQRLSYQWDADVQEWFVNDQRGLEHGFTVSRRPAGAAADAALDVVLGTRGTLKASVAADAQTIYFRDGAGAPVVTYAGLKVWDADGLVLPSSFVAGPEGGIILRVEESAARYPITIDPIAQQAYLKPSEASRGSTGASDNFGYSVAVSGDTVVVGAYNDDSRTTGINSTPDELASGAGAAYVFVRSGGTWSQQAYLKAAQVTAGDNFGSSVAVSGDTVVVGAFGEDGSVAGINGTPDELANGAGAAYVFVRSGGTWSQQAYLKASQVTAGDSFGLSVALSGDTVVVGASNEDSSTIGINSTPDELASSAGAAYVFVRSSGTWSQQAYLKAAQVTAADNFGSSVAVSGDTVVVGVVNEDGSATGINGTPDELAIEAGAAYVFVRSGGTWSQQAYLKASQVTAGDSFGRSVAVSGNTLVVGASSEDSSTTGINSTPNQGSNRAGAAYVFVRSGSTWSQQAYLKASQVSAFDEFGNSVAVDGDTVVVGVPQEDSSTTGINSTPNELASIAGAAYVFVRSGGTWSQQAYLKASQVSANDQFGTSVAVSGDTVVVGASNEDSSTTGVNSIPDELASNSGAAYIFSGLGPVAPAPTVTNVSPATGSTAGGTSVTITGTDFTGASAVTFGGTAATSFTVDSATQITAVTPAGTAGAASVLVTTAGGANAANTLFTYVAPPTVTNVSPATGSTLGGTSVTITGTDFTGASAVTFGGTAATSFTVDSATQITAVTPAKTAGAVSVLVTTSAGSNVANADFTYASPNTAPSFAIPTGINTPAGQTWTARDSNRSWISIASSADGNKLVAAVTNGQLYTSTDGGITWVARDNNRAWTCVASSSDGAKLVATVSTGQIFTSTDSGVTWTARDSSRAWQSVASSTDGTKLVASVSAGLLYTSTDSGLTWTPREFTRQWRSVTSSADGTILGATTSGGFIYISTDSGVTWTVRRNDQGRDWRAIDCSADGSKFFAVANGQPIQVSTDGGVTWAIRVGNAFWTGIACTADGNNAVAVPSNLTIYTTTNSGANWTFRDSSRNWNAVTASDNGLKYVATTSNGQIYTSDGVAQLHNIIVQTSSGVSTTPGFASNISPGPVADSGQTVSFTVTNDNNALFTAQPAVASNGTLTFTPGSTAGTATVTVTAVDSGGTTNGGTDTSAAQTFTITVTQAAPTLASISPSLGSTAGGTSVTITGTDFTGATGVTFGGTAATSFTVDSATQITAVTPSGTAGAASVLVTTAGGTNAANTLFTYVTPPTVTNVSPALGSTVGGTSVVITGTDFTGASAVTFGGTAATSFTVDSATQITAVTPAGGAGAVSVLVTTAGGTNAANTLFTYVAPPTVTNVSPATGSTAGFTMVTITGTKFSDASSVRFGGTDAAFFFVDSDTQITAYTPSRAAGVVDVSVVTPEGSGVGTGLFTYVVPNSAPSFSLPPGDPGPAGVVWTQRTSGFDSWNAITSSADGTKLAAVIFGGRIFTSADSGATWTARENNRNWTSITSSADGSKLAAVVSAGQIYTSTDSGVTWTARESSRSWTDIASSADGSKLVATTYAGPIYTSTDSGATWTARASGSFNWQTIASSADGSKLVAGVYGGQVYTSTDSGVTWTARDSSRNWYSIASSTDGSKLAAIAFGGQIYTSTDSGVTWTARDSSRNWNSIASSADGSKLVATVSFNLVYISGDSGVTWTAQDTSRRWVAVASSADGSKLVAAVTNGQIFTSVPVPLPPVLTVLVGSGASTTPNFATNISPGPASDNGQTVSFTVTNNNNALFTTQPAIANDGTLTFTPGNTVGSAIVTVTAVDNGGTAAGGVDSSAAQTFTIQVSPPAPTVTNVSPATGSTLGGTSVVITGTDFTGASAVTFGGTAATSFTVDSATQITATTPAGTAGAASVLVTTPSGSNAANSLYTYAVPNTAPMITSNASGSSALSSVLSRLDAQSANLRAFVPNPYPFTDGITGSSISDGGDDMYDSGNLLYTSLGGPILYSDGLITADGGTGGSYFTRKHTGFFTFVADLQGATNFTISGNLGADSSGFTSTGVLTRTVAGVTYKGFFKRVYGAIDPSINQLIIVPDRPGLSQTAATDTNDGLHSVSGLSGNTRLYYLLFASSSGGFVSDAVYGNIMDYFLQNVATNALTRVAGASGVSVPVATVSDSETAAGSLTVTATTVPAGINVTGITNSSGTISAIVTADAATVPGEYIAVLTVSDGSLTANANLVVTVVALPSVVSISPNSGSTVGGTAVTISGNYFTGATGVTIGGAAATSVVVVNSTTITAVTPAGTAGTASVVVTTPIGSNAANSLYTYVVPNFAPVITSNGGDAAASINVAENSTAVTTVTATDADTPAQTLTFTKTGADAALFNLDSATGVLRFITAPNYEAPADSGLNNIYDVRVTVTDSGSPALNDIQDISVIVTDVNENPAIRPSSSFLAYETVNPTRNASGLIVYTTNNAAALAAQPFNRVRYRMENTTGGVAYFADASFDAWSGVTVAGLKVPDAGNILTTRRNVTNVSIRSNHPRVTNSNTELGRLEHWTNNYSPQGIIGGSASLYDYDDTPETPIIGYGSFQLHNLSTTVPHTVFAWNNHTNGVTPEVGFGNSTIGIHPDWTFTNTGTNAWRMQIYIENNYVPPTMSFTEDVVGNILFFNSPFQDDSASLTVTLAVVDGTVTGNAGTGITVGGTATSRTFTGSVADLNAYFTTPGKVTYLGALNNTASRVLTVTVSDGTLSASTTSTIYLAPVNDVPTDIAVTPSNVPENNEPNAIVGTLSTTDPDVGDTFTYSLVAGTGDTDNASFSIVGNTLRITPSVDFETKPSYSIRVRTTEASTAFFEKALTISVRELLEQDIAYDDFRRTSDSGSGWSGNWSVANPAVANLAYPPLNSGGNAAGSGAAQRFRSLSSAQTTGVVYISAMLKGGGYCNLTLYDDSQEKVSFGVVYDPLRGTFNPNFGLFDETRKFEGAAAMVPSTVAVDTATHFILARVDLDLNTVEMWVDPNLSLPLGAPNCTSRAGSFGGSNYDFNRVRLEVTGAAVMDEVRIMAGDRRLVANRTTSASITSPTVANVKNTKATLGGDITQTGGTAILERGVVYAPTATNNNPEVGGTGVGQTMASGTSTGVFSVEVTGLLAGTNYSYKAYARNAIGTTYTLTTGTFTTLTLPEPIAADSGDVISNGLATGADGTSPVGSYGVLRRGGFLAENGVFAYPGYLLTGSGSPAVTVSDNSGIWKVQGGNPLLVARTGTTVPDVPGARFATLPEVPGLSEAGDVSMLSTLVIGSGGVTSANDSGLWSEIGGGGLRLLLREDDNIPSLAGVKVGSFASGVYATARTGASTGEAVFSVTYRGASTKTALLRTSVSGATTSVSVVAQEGETAPGTSPAANYVSVAGSYSDPGRMDAQGNFVYAALTSPGNKEGIWYQPVTGGTPAKVFFAGEIAPGTGGATFGRLQRPSMGSNGFISFRATLNRDGDNAANARNDGIWNGNAADPASFTCVLRRGDGVAKVSNLPAGSLVGNPWGGWLTNSNLGAWRAWLDVDGDGISSTADGDVNAIFANLSGAMRLAVKVGDAAPGTAAATFSGFDLPMVGGNNQYAILGNLTGGDTVTANNQGLWKSAPNGGALTLAIRKGETIVTTEGPKTVTKIDVPGSNQTDRRWEQPVMDSTGRMVVYVTFADGSTSQVVLP